MLPKLATDIERLVKRTPPACDKDAVDGLFLEPFLEALTDQGAEKQVQLLAPTKAVLRSECIDMKQQPTLVPLDSHHH